MKRLTGLGTSSSDLQADNFTISESTNLEDIISLINDLETYFQNFVGSDLQTQPSWLKANLESVFRPYDIDGHALLELRRRMPARNMPGIEERIRQFIDAVDYGLNNAGDPVKLDESQVRAVIGLILFETFVVEASLWSRRGRHEVHLHLIIQQVSRNLRSKGMLKRLRGSNAVVEISEETLFV